MNLRSVLGFSVLTACSAAVPPAPPPEVDARVVRRDAGLDVIPEIPRNDAGGVDRFVPDVVRDSVVDRATDAAIDSEVEIAIDAAADSLDVVSDAVDVRDAADVVAPSRAATRLGVTLPCPVRDMEVYSSGVSINLFAICEGTAAQRLIHVSDVLGRSPAVRRFTDIPASSSELRDLVKIADATETLPFGEWAVVAATSVYRMSPDDQVFNVSYPAGHQDGVAALFVGGRLYVATTYASASEGEVLSYIPNTAGSFTLRQTSDAGVSSHVHIGLRNPILAMESGSASINPRWALTGVVSFTSLIGFNTDSDMSTSGRSYSEVRPSAQSELQRTADGRFVVFGTQDNRLFSVNTTNNATLAAPYITNLSDTSGIADVRVASSRAYVSTRSGTVFVYSIPDGVLQETITTSTSPITAAEVISIGGTNQILFAGAGGLYAANL